MTYANEMAAKGKNLVAVINLDMVGNDAGLRRSIVYVATPDAPTHPGELAIAQTLLDVARVYSLDITPVIKPTCG